ncbi:DNA repair protein [Paecilomyces variotii No. 5]|uniref:Protein artemis n=1 Tax=Byssochlamys spectabilis (strain No. 5 / NBRC 109023) TaxID=1356009 RepID=V5FW13_BYSSN|nr:DNA repair protein [Paecilomyces variotii No. 5]
MSTFDGVVEEFPFIRIDYFRKNPDRPSPLACFLSHVHSDHLQGLESLRSPFVYCSAASRELLLRIEKYPHRMNFSKGILESRKQHYKHLAKLLRPIPLNTPTVIELTPRLRIRVTLLDANHCLGAVMFLIEGDSKAVLYTGDIRAETWWVNSLVRHPVLIPYTLGHKRLDKIYLDTTFAIKSDVYRSFSSKAEGLRELLEKIHAYPEDTVFYLRAWTFGYEDVWLALATALHSKIHVDRYQRGLYQSLYDRRVPEAAFLCGFDLGNNFTAGCLTDDESCRIHSCEPGMFCPVIVSGKAVYITPIVTRSSDGEVPEIGVGGGGGDLYQSHELELPDETSVEQLEKLCLEHIHDPEILTQTKEALINAFRSKKKTLSLDKYGLKDENDISLRKLVDILSHGRSFDTTNDAQHEQRQRSGPSPRPEHQLPKQITFPYSRHSSYAELCELVAAFRPKDIYPCTVDPENWSEDVSIARLFGHLCSADTFSHDDYMYKLLSEQQQTRQQMQHASLSTQSPRSSEYSSQMSRALLYQSAMGPVGYNGVLETNNHQLPKTSSSDPPRLLSEPPSSLSTSSMASLRRIPDTTSNIPHRNGNCKPHRPDHETTHRTQQGHQEHPPNNSHPIPERTEHARKARNQLRRVWYKTEALQRQGRWHVHNEPLPPWWPTEEEDRYHDESSDEDDSTDVDALDRIAHPAPEDPSTTNMGSLASSDADMNTGTDANAEPDLDPDTHLDSQTSNNLSLSLSLSESAFDSQEQPPSPSNTTSDYGHQPNTDNNNTDNNDRSKPSGTTKRKRSPASTIQNRIRAYHAARSGSWSEVSLLSAGNNHTEEEMEL